MGSIWAQVRFIVWGLLLSQFRFRVSNPFHAWVHVRVWILFGLGLGWGQRFALASVCVGIRGSFLVLVQHDHRGAFWAQIRVGVRGAFLVRV